FGAFADDHRDRNRLGPFARARAYERHGREFAASEIDVIGDTPRDIACGKALGARTVAVATGTWSRDRLAEYHPDFLIDDLSNVTYIDSAGLAALIQAMQKVEAYGGKFSLAGLQETVRSIFEISRLDQVFQIFPDTDSALAAR